MWDLVGVLLMVVIVGKWSDESSSRTSQWRKLSIRVLEIRVASSALKVGGPSQRQPIRVGEPSLTHLAGIRWIRH